MKKIFVFLTFCILMSSCVMDEEILSETKPISTFDTKALTVHYKMNEVSESQEIPNQAFSHVKLSFRNEMPNLYLIVEKLQICNIHIAGNYHFPTEYSKGYWTTDTTQTSIILETGEIELSSHQEFTFPTAETLRFIPQTIRTWDPTHLPQNTEQSYILLCCKIYDIHDTDKGYQEEQEVLIWGDEKGNCQELAIPLSIHFLSDQEHFINIELSTDCSWYNINGNEPRPILTPITFDASVEDWKNCAEQLPL